METEKNASVLEDLVETLEDGRKGFTQAAEKLADDGKSDIASKFKTYAQEREAFGAELRQLASQMGNPIEENGSAGGAMHRGWIALADALTGDNAHAVLSAAEAGEDHAVSEYKDAMDADDLAPEVRTVINNQYEKIKMAHDEVKRLRDADNS